MARDRDGQRQNWPTIDKDGQARIGQRQRWPKIDMGEDRDDQR